MYSKFTRISTVLFCAVIIQFLVGCGGGSSGGNVTPSSSHSVSGKVTYNGAGIANVAVNLASAGAVVASTVTDSNGLYLFKVPAGAYSVNSADTKYGFDPSTVTVNGADLTVPDAVAFPSYNVTGKASLLSNGSGLAGVTITLLKTRFTITPVGSNLYGATVAIDAAGATAVTDNTGSFTFYGVPAGSYTIKPSSAAYIFNPAQSDPAHCKSFTIITGNPVVYLYDPDTTGNSVIGTDIIYNSTVPITDSNYVPQNFVASPATGGGVNVNIGPQ